MWLKKFEKGQFKEVKQSTTKIFTKVCATVSLKLFTLITRLLNVFLFGLSSDEGSQE